jgi:hypothetical protein
VLVVEERAEVGWDIEESARVTAGQNDDRHRVAEGLGHTAEGIFGARPVLHREHADTLARGHPAHRVGHVQAGALLAHDDGADVGLGRGLDDRVDRIADQELHTLALENFRHHGCSFHPRPPSLAPNRTW